MDEHTAAPEPSFSDMAIAILHATHDGEDRAPEDLELVELGVNGRLSDAGREAFRALHQRAVAGYVRPWLHGIEHITIRHNGNVYWKDAPVESMLIRYVYPPEGKQALEEVALRCRVLEARGSMGCALLRRARRRSIAVGTGPAEPAARCRAAAGTGRRAAASPAMTRQQSPACTRSTGSISA